LVPKMLVLTSTDPAVGAEIDVHDVPPLAER
jgi:hypothetical protein